MILVKPSFKIMAIMTGGIEADGSDYVNALELIEHAGRTCYKSEDNIYPRTAQKFVEKINDLGHESVLEHSSMVVKFICDRGVSYELVSHRLCSFSQESTRYCNYKGGVTFVIPPWIKIPEGEYTEKKFDFTWSDNPKKDGSIHWMFSLFNAEEAYKYLINCSWSPQQARSVLPNSIKTEIVVTANFREWKHIFTLGTSKAAHPQMREIMIPLLDECKKLIPVIFNNIKY